MSYDILYSDCEQESFLSPTIKHDLSSKRFSNPLICYQPPKQFETWDGSLVLAMKGLTKKKKWVAYIQNGLEPVAVLQKIFHINSFNAVL